MLLPSVYFLVMVRLISVGVLGQHIGIFDAGAMVTQGFQDTFRSRIGIPSLSRLISIF